MVNQYCAYSFARNWQLPFLNQQKGEIDHRKYFMIGHMKQLRRWCDILLALRARSARYFANLHHTLFLTSLLWIVSITFPVHKNCDIEHVLRANKIYGFCVSITKIIFTCVFFFFFFFLAVWIISSYCKCKVVICHNAFGNKCSVCRKIFWSRKKTALQLSVTSINAYMQLLL